MKNIHTIPLNIGDFLTDTVGMKAIEVGAYISLYIAHMQMGEDGLPYDPKKLAYMARVSDKVWKGGLGQRMLEKFHIIPHPSGNPAYTQLANERCIESIQRINGISFTNSRNALKRWRGDNTVALRPQNKRNPIQR